MNIVSSITQALLPHEREHVHAAYRRFKHHKNTRAFVIEVRRIMPSADATVLNQMIRMDESVGYVTNFFFHRVEDPMETSFRGKEDETGATCRTEEHVPAVQATPASSELFKRINIE